MILAMVMVFGLRTEWKGKLVLTILSLMFGSRADSRSPSLSLTHSFFVCMCLSVPFGFSNLCWLHRWPRKHFEKLHHPDGKKHSPHTCNCHRTLKTLKRENTCEIAIAKLTLISHSIHLRKIGSRKYWIFHESEVWCQQKCSCANKKRQMIYAKMNAMSN